ncbi:MAG: polyether ionophore transport system permease protein [Micromonosporaceae bacterium]|jgi:ABC-2 type transport system permease protein|nr:polyether ionophore transport system permease protein [Micromonosporaceae bacterium]
MKGGFSGTGPLIRLALRLDRIRLPIWVLVIAASVAGTASSYQKLYPTAAERIRIGDGIAHNPSLLALSGPIFNPAAIGGLTAWKVLTSAVVAAALMSLFTTVRHTRAEEEAGRLELVGAAVVGRYAPLTATLVVAVGANAAIALAVTAALAGTGLPAGGSIAFGLAIAAGGVVFTGVAAVTAQLVESARAATGAAAAVLGGAYLLRAVGDTGPTWLSWLSPIGWSLRLRPYAGDRWWTLALTGALTVVLAATAYALVGRRDLGAGLFAARLGPAAAAPGLRSPLALAWRLHRGMLVGWLVGVIVWGAVLGAAAAGIEGLVTDDSKIVEILARMGGRKGIIDAFLATSLSLAGLAVAGYAVQATLRLRAEEAAQRAEPVLAARVGRIRWAASHLVFATVGAAGLLAAGGAATGLAYGLRVHDVGGEVPRLLGAGLVQLPAALVLAGVATALFGLAPRYAVAGWGALAAFGVLLELGALLRLNHWIMDVSPFTHVPKLPGSAFAITPLVWLVAVAAALTCTGLAAFRRRDVG